jgi:hypothetical protein
MMDEYIGVFGKYGGLCENAANLLGDVLGAMQGC